MKGRRKETESEQTIHVDEIQAKHLQLTFQGHKKSPSHMSLCQLSLETQRAQKTPGAVRQTGKQRV